MWKDISTISKHCEIHICKRILNLNLVEEWMILGLTVWVQALMLNERTPAYFTFQVKLYPFFPNYVTKLDIFSLPLIKAFFAILFLLQCFYHCIKMHLHLHFKPQCRGQLGGVSVLCEKCVVWCQYITDRLKKIKITTSKEEHFLICCDSCGERERKMIQVTSSYCWWKSDGNWQSNETLDEVRIGCTMLTRLDMTHWA